MYRNRRVWKTFQGSLCLSRVLILSAVARHFFLYPPAVNSSLAVTMEDCFPEILTLVTDTSLFPSPFPDVSNLFFAESTTPLKVKPFKYWLPTPP